MLKLNLPKFQELLVNLNVIFDAAVSFYNENGECFANNPGSKSVSKAIMCPLVKKYSPESCVDSDANVIAKLKSEGSRDYFYYVCPCGYVEIAMRVKFNDQTMGFILIGPFRAPDDNEQARKRLNRFIDNFNLDRDEIQRLYDSAPSFTDEKFKAVRVILSAITEYMQLKEFLVVNSDFFSEYVVAYINDHIDGDLSIETLCHEFGMSTTLLYKTFKNKVNTTPQAYIKQTRIKKACKLLKSTQKPLRDVCSAVGISDYNYFIKIFKSYMGMTPNAYRNDDSQDA